MGAPKFGAALMAATCALAVGGGSAASAQTVQTLGTGNTLLSFSAAAPGTVTRSVAVTGVAAGTSLAGIDYRPASPRVLYSISNVGQLYAINSRTGGATAIGTPATPTISAIGFDFNPTVDRIRVITQIGQNFRVNPDTGALAATDGSLAYAAGDANFGQVPTAAGVAYTNNVAGATTTTLYAIDTRGGLAAARLVTQGNLAGTVSPNTGALFTVGSTGVVTATSVGFDISREGAAYASLTNPTTGVTSLYSINLTTGAATLVGAFAGNTTYNGLAIQLASFSSMGATANQAAVGATLDGFTGMPGGRTLELFNAIDGSFATPGAQSAALLALTPAAYSYLTDMSLNATESQETIIGQVADGLRAGTGAMANGARTAMGGEGKLGAWISGGGRFGHYNARADRYAAQTDEIHFLGGVDYRVIPNVAAGVFGGYSSTSAELGPNGSHGNLRSTFGGGYATGSLGPIYLTGWGSYTDLRWNLRRDVAIGTFTDFNAARTRGRVYSAGGTAGLKYAFGRIDLQPMASVRYADVRINRFTEVGGPTALFVSQFNDESLRSNLGGKIGITYDIAGASLTPSVHGGWYHEFMNRADVYNAQFQNAAISTPFGFANTPLGRNYYNAGGGLELAGGGPISGFARYDRQFDKERKFNSFTIGARLVF